VIQNGIWDLNTEMKMMMIMHNRSEGISGITDLFFFFLFLRKGEKVSACETAALFRVHEAVNSAH
jgi:hypothetical protein